MHEARAVNVAVEEALEDVSAIRAAGGLRLEIVDATRASEDAVSFYAAALLRERGLGDLALTVVTRPLTCGLCGAAAIPTVAHPVCEACGAPLRSLAGPAVLCHAVETTEDAGAEAAVVAAGAGAS